MVKVKTFANELKIFHIIPELDEKVNAFRKENKIKKIVSVNDACTFDN